MKANTETENLNEKFEKQMSGADAAQDYGGNFWKRDNGFLIAVSVYFIAMLLFVGLRVAGGFGFFNVMADEFGGEATEIISTVIIQIFIFFIVPILLVKIFAKQPLGRTLLFTGFNRPSWCVVGYAFLLGALLFLFNNFVATLSHMALLVLGFRFPSGDSSFVGLTGLLVSIVIVGVLPGVCEETSNRGVLMNGLASKLGPWRAVLISALCFGLMHLNIVQAIYATVLGIFMGLAVFATRSIWTGVIIHFMNNALGQFMAFAQKNNWAIAELLDRFFGLFTGVLFFALICGVYILIINIIHKFARENFKANEKNYFANFLKSNPEYVSAKIDAGQGVTLADMSQSIDAHTAKLGRTRAIRFYLEGQYKPQTLGALEKTMLFGILFLTTVVTGMTLVWGLL